MTLRNPIHTELLDKCKEIHDKKSHDYSQDDNVFSNFEYAAKVAEIFTGPVDKTFATMIGVKLARLAELRKGKVPKNESIEDTIIDFINYAAIWGSMVVGGMRKPVSRLCKCEHRFDYHLELLNGGRGECSECKLGMALDKSAMCKQFISMYDYLGQQVK